MFAGLMHDATPVGFGIQGPANGKWDSAVVEFSDWKMGSGTIAEESCVQMTATELLQSHHANHGLWVFDQLMGQLKSTEPLSSALTYLPAQLSQIFASAAKLESNNFVEVASTNLSGEKQSSSTAAWTTMAIASVAGVVGVGFVVMLAKTQRVS